MRARDPGLEPRYLGAGLGYPLGQDRLLIGERRLPTDQAIALAGEHPGERPVLAGGGEEVLREGDGGRTRLLREEPCLDGAERAPLRQQGGVLGSGARGVQLDQRLAGHHLAAVPDEDVADNSALEVLHGLAATFRRDHRRGDRGTRERRRHRPTTEAGEEQAGHEASG